MIEDTSTAAEIADPTPPGRGDRQIRGACPLDCPDTCSWIYLPFSRRSISRERRIAATWSNPRALLPRVESIVQFLTISRPSG